MRAICKMRRIPIRVLVRILIGAVILAAAAASPALGAAIKQPTPARLVSVGQSKPSPRALDIPTISYCDLVREPARYQDTLVRVNAQYRTGFEVSYLYDLACVKGKTPLEQSAARQETWLGFDGAHQPCWQPPLARMHKTSGGRGATADVTVVGTFYGPDKRHQPAPGGKYQFIAQCFEIREH
jgi:hypothetical protein